MRRLREDARPNHSNLLRLSSEERLFVQRWIELFDRSAIRGARCRPFWPDKVRAERAQHVADRGTDFHVAILDEELSAVRVEQLDSLDLTQLRIAPAEVAERLASSVITLGYHPAYLFHAFKAMLFPTVPFDTRLKRLRDWWTTNARDRDMTVAFRVTRTGNLPPGLFPDIRLVKWHDLDVQIRGRAESTKEWGRHAECAERNAYFLVVTANARDADGAAERALHRYEEYHRGLRAASHAVRVIEIDEEWAFVHDSEESPAAKAYPIRMVSDRFRLRGRYDRAFAATLTSACASSRSLRQFAECYAKAMEEAKAGRPRDALPHIASAQDLAFGDYGPTGKEKEWGAPRLLVEKASILMSLDWCRSQYAYLLEHCLKTSFHFGGKSVLSEPRPEAAFDIIAHDHSWNEAVNKCPWDELLKFRRSRFLQDATNLPATLQQQRRQLRWDLARAVRARNSLFHQGLPLQDEYLLAVFLDAFELVLRLRVVAHQHAMAFGDLVRKAERDFQQITSGADSPPDCRTFASFGWRRWRSKAGDDIDS